MTFSISGKSLIWVGVLGLVVFYVYALISFALLRSSFDADDMMYCATLWQCTVTVIRYGLVGDIFDVSISTNIANLLAQHSFSSQGNGEFGYLFRRTGNTEGNYQKHLKFYFQKKFYVSLMDNGCAEIVEQPHNVENCFPESNFCCLIRFMTVIFMYVLPPI